MDGRAGAIMLEDMRVTIPPREVRRVTAHLVVSDQLYGFEGSVGLSQVTYILPSVS